MEPAKFIRKWERKRTKGPLKHIVLHSVVIPVGGLCGGIIGTTLGHGDVHRFLANSPFGVAFLFLWGLGIGVFDWKRNESKYKTLVEKGEPPLPTLR
ncbi:hypothetical protein Desaci_2550 [Desulfosporosinus acidiphilus SJ4]|uniref:Uncharacterized protein n=1 Tax=Desulfosporosinus acidiphilus (strain DSM 22704 / JCM 16185 / SJ4) TaxID=646529 RepID=I4D6R7_DESAJ|nr:hypothetical protein [Desulfosporosinus acidiphilus]AFM41491.1 hypothetical protein Desaci_2550 [Desulfosporosinus acidiphilus SJ4]